METMEFDVLIVGAGPAGLSAACRLLQQAKSSGQELSVCILEKGSEVGAHIISGAVFEPSALDDLFPDWRTRGAPVEQPVIREQMLYLSAADTHRAIPRLLQPRSMHNQGNYIISLGNLCRWLAEQASALGAEIFPGFSAHSLLIEDKRVQGVVTGELGRNREGQELPGFTPAMAIRARATLLCEGCRGHLGKQAIRRFGLVRGRDPQHYALGIKEIWQMPAGRTTPGLVVHSAGWPLSETTSTGGGFVYHLNDQQIVLGLVTDLCYRNPHLDPFKEFQRYKTHPAIRTHIEGGERIGYGARALVKGGLQSLPRMDFPGGLLLGDDAGTLNAGKIKGIHCAMRSGMLGADTLFNALQAEDQEQPLDLTAFTAEFKHSSLYRELRTQRNFVPFQHRFGLKLGAALAYLDINLLGGHPPWTWHDSVPDFAKLKSVQEARPPFYPKPDGVLTFDRPSSVYLANTNHREDQPCHLQLIDPELPVTLHLQRWQEPAQRYCPAGVYEVLYDADDRPYLQINAQNCVHCKTCDIKDPSQNIRWVPPEGGGGPNYPNM